MGVEERARVGDQMARMEERAKLAENEKHALLVERRKLKGMMAAQKRTKDKSRRNGSKTKTKKKDFASVALSIEGSNAQELALTTSNTLGLETASKSADAISTGLQTFSQHVSDDGHIYYSNIDTGETMWELPEGAALL